MYDYGLSFVMMNAEPDRIKEAEDLAKVVTEQLVKVEGITRTMKPIAFRCFSNCDLEHIFSIGN